jgi:hypothetical protein
LNIKVLLLSIGKPDVILLFLHSPHPFTCTLNCVWDQQNHHHTHLPACPFVEQWLHKLQMPQHPSPVCSGPHPWYPSQMVILDYNRTPHSLQENRPKGKKHQNLLSRYQISKQASRLVTQLWTWKQPHCALLNPQAPESAFVVQFQICEKNSKAVLNLPADLFCSCESASRLVVQLCISEKDSYAVLNLQEEFFARLWISEKDSYGVLDLREEFLCSFELVRSILMQLWICKLRLVVQLWIC